MSEGGGDQRSAGRVGKVSLPDTSRTRDKIGAFAGVSGRTVEKIAAIVAAAEAEPERFGKLAADMDRTGRVNGPLRRLKVARQAEAIRKEPSPLPGNGPYRVIVIDPPWPWPFEIHDEDPSHRAVYPYPTMSIAQIAALRVADIAHEHCILWLWTTNFHMGEALSLAAGWGFEHKRPDLGQRQVRFWRLAEMPNRACAHGDARQADGPAHQPIDRAVRAGARPLRKA
jgi:hypothetical protein